MSGESSSSRTEWGSRFGYLMAMIGAMVGAGSIWRLPFKAGQHGGGVFLILYILLILVISVPGLMAENLIGRYTQKGVIGAFREIFDRPSLQGLGIVVFLVNIALMSYYLPILGWALYYLVHSFLFTFMQPGFQPQAFWDAFISSPVLTLGTHTITALAVAGVLSLGIKDGIERVVKYLIPLLVLSLIAIAIRGITLSGGVAGLAFAFSPNWEYLSHAETWIAALGQALYATGLGWGVALTFGSYLRKYDDIPLGGGIFTAIGTTAVGILAISAVFPVVFAFGLEPAAGSNLTFISLVNVFPQMPGGAFWAIVFFGGFFMAAFSSGFGLTEVAVTTVAEETSLSRTKSVLTVVFVIWLLGIPSALSQNFLNSVDFMFGNWGLPTAALSVMALVGWKFTPERARVLELNRNSDVYIGSWWNSIVKYVIPATMIIIMGSATVDSLGTENEMLVFGGIGIMTLIVLGSLIIPQLFDCTSPLETDPAPKGGD